MPLSDSRSGSPPTRVNATRGAAVEKDCAQIIARRWFAYTVVPPATSKTWSSLAPTASRRPLVDAESVCGSYDVPKYRIKAPSGTLRI